MNFPAADPHLPSLVHMCTRYTSQPKYARLVVYLPQVCTCTPPSTHFYLPTLVCTSTSPSTYLCDTGKTSVMPCALLEPINYQLAKTIQILQESPIGANFLDCTNLMRIATECNCLLQNWLVGMFGPAPSLRLFGFLLGPRHAPLCFLPTRPPAPSLGPPPALHAHQHRFCTRICIIACHVGPPNGAAPRGPTLVMAMLKIHAKSRNLLLFLFFLFRFCFD